MFCNKCGKEVNDDAVVCINCGCQINEKKEVTSKDDSSALGIGVVCALFLGPLGLLVMLCYSKGSFARKSFLRGWLWTFVITAIIGVIVGIIAGVSAASLFDSLLDWTY